MARSSRLTKPASQDLLRLEVVAVRRLAPHWMRVTLGGGDIGRFAPLGYDQWFRLFLPHRSDSAGAGLERIPAKANRIFGYLSYLRIPEGIRPAMRNYTVRAYRASGPSGGAELDVDFVLHGSGPTAGPASRWAASATVGESVVIIDEGLGFSPERGVERVLLIADETGVPAVSGVCASLPSTATGTVLVEAPSADDVLEIDAPEGVEVRWLVRDAGACPGTLALSALRQLDPPAPDTHVFVVGEQSLPVAARRHLVASGHPKDRISFVGYWRAGSASPTPAAERSGAEEH